MEFLVRIADEIYQKKKLADSYSQSIKLFLENNCLDIFKFDP